MKKILYLSLTGMAEPLGQSQVLEYLVDLAKQNEITLFSFERVQDWDKLSELSLRMKANKIHWIYHRYSNRFGLFSTIWMLFTAMIRLLGLICIRRPKIIHARSLLPALLGWPLAKIGHAKLIFDIRGFAIDEKVDSGRLKKNSSLYKILRGLEKFLYRRCDHIVTLTYAAKKILCQELALNENKITVIPTCANKDLFYPLTTQERQKIRKELGFIKTQKILIHTGTVSGWYDFGKEVALFAQLYKQDESFHFIVLNRREHSFIHNTFLRHCVPDKAYTVASAPLHEVVRWLNSADAALFFIKPSYSKQASAPTKFAELVACHIPTITNSDVGDMNFYIESYPVGISVKLNDLSKDLRQYAEKVEHLLAQPIDVKKYDQLFAEHFDKTLAVKYYNIIYSSLSA